MKAYQVVEFGTPLVARELPDPTPEASAVVVEVMSCGLCHTDVHLPQQRVM
jgi:alcohol dehydrogenase, propanol-preferring